ncbi:MAG: hypothetical protein HS129_15095 [Leptospiraceae bacterium]|nr:hypothetical protein [Leptospiraceae bacterium]
MNKEMTKRKLNFDSSGWASLECGVKVHTSGKAFVGLRACGSFIPQPIQIKGQNLETAPAVQSSPANKITPSGLRYEEFLFRILSKTYISDYYLDFTKDNVLKSALSLFSTKVFRNHFTSIEDSIGTISNPEWTNSKGLEGIDGLFRLYYDFADDVIKRLQADPPVLDSVSAGIHFLWEKSHPDLDGFYWFLGQELEGSIVRFVVTKILSVPEVSVVYAGADPNAKKLFANQNNGIIFDKESETREENFQEDKEFSGEADLSQSASGDTGAEEKPKEDSLKIKTALLKVLGVAVASLGFKETDTEVELNPDQMVSVLQSMEKQIAGLKTEKTSAEGNLKKLATLFALGEFPDGFDFEKKVSELSGLLDEPKKILQGYREAALKAYRVFVNGKESPAMVSMIQNANLEQSKALCQEYGAKLEDKFPVKCNQCGSSDITRASGETGLSSGKPDDYITVRK